uniref:SAM-dependent methyltransferase Erg6/SMT-type domain-containing protein n=1 Tax=Ananas comosus var. bracteatus TaxID=296719 RepID=A0A6V7QNF8_ANACO|nr:unnamed protein product [Ananas comosus var. bracteatus]
MEASTSATLLWTGAVWRWGWVTVLVLLPPPQGALRLRHRRRQRPNIINTYYDLITDITEWGWASPSTSPPPSPPAPTATPTRLHEERVADLLSSGPSTGCSTSAAASAGPCAPSPPARGAHIVGITINQYQVGRARAHNRKAGLDGRCEYLYLRAGVCGNFLEMPFEDASFDAAYSIEATCHAPHLEDVYGEIFRALKPGGMYVTYEWVTTPLYRADDAGHVETVHGIERGSALPGIRRRRTSAGRRERWGLKWWRSGTWRCRRRGPGGSGSRWAGWPTGGTTSSSPSSPSSASPPGASSRSTICSTRPQSTSPAAADRYLHPHAHDPLPQAASRRGPRWCRKLTGN